MHIIIQDLGIRPGYRFNHMTPKMFAESASGFPILRGKAAEVRNIGKPLLKVFVQHMNPKLRSHKNIKLAMQLSTRFEDILDEHEDEWVLPPAGQDELLKCAVGFCQACTAIGHEFHDRQHKSLFNFTIKFHYLIHIALMAKFCNPRKLWCYAGEDLMQRGRQIIQYSVRGTPYWLVCTKVMKKYIVGLSYTRV